MTDISKAAVDVLADQHEKYIRRITGLSDLGSVEADTLRALRAALDEAEARAVKAEAERDAAVEAKLDAISTLDAWFDRRKLGHEAVDQAIVDAASGYLRTSRVGGMPQDESNLILGVIQDMARLGMFADLLARAHLGAKP